MLEILSDTNLNWYFNRTPEADGNVGRWLSFASNVDGASRSLIRWCLAMATSAATQKEKKWLQNKNAMDLDPSEEIRATNALVLNSEQLIDARRREVKELRERLSYLMKTGKVLGQHFDKISKALPPPKTVRASEASKMQKGPLKK